MSEKKWQGSGSDPRKGSNERRQGGDDRREGRNDPRKGGSDRRKGGNERRQSGNDRRKEPETWVLKCAKCGTETSVPPATKPLEGMDPPAIDTSCPQCGSTMKPWKKN